MATPIFENKVVEKTATGETMQFPSSNDDDITNYLPSDGQQFLVKDEKGTQIKDKNGTQIKLTCKKGRQNMCFADGWRGFCTARGITYGDKISFYKEDDSFGPVAKYKIIVENKKGEKAVYYLV